MGIRSILLSSPRLFAPGNSKSRATACLPAGPHGTGGEEHEVGASLYIPGGGGGGTETGAKNILARTYAMPPAPANESATIRKIIPPSSSLAPASPGVRARETSDAVPHPPCEAERTRNAQGWPAGKPSTSQVVESVAQFVGNQLRPPSHEYCTVYANAVLAACARPQYTFPSVPMEPSSLPGGAHVTCIFANPERLLAKGTACTLTGGAGVTALELRMLSCAFWARFEKLLFRELMYL